MSEALVERGQAALTEAYLRTGDYDAVDVVAGEALAAARVAGDRRSEAAALALQGMTLHYRAIDLPAEERSAIDLRPEEELFELALAARREIDDAEGVAESLFQLGLVHQVLRRDLESGSPYVREAFAVIEAVPDADALLRSEIHRHVGFDLLLREERHAVAIHHFQASLELRRGLAEGGWVVSGLIALALADRLAGRTEEAVLSSRQALELARGEGLRERFVAGAEDSLRAAEEAASGEKTSNPGMGRS